MRHPLAIPASLYGLGILLGHSLAPPLALLFAVSFGLGLAALAFDRFRPAALCALLLAFGWTNLVSRTAVLSPHDLRLVQADETTIATVRATLTETPQQRVFVRDDKPSWRTVAEVAVREVRRDSAWRPAFGTVAVTTPGILGAEFFSGRTVEVTGVLQPPGFRPVEGAFDYRTYLEQKGIHYLLKTEGTNDWRLVPGVPAPARPWADRFQDWARRTLAKGLPEEDEPLRLLWAMTLGWKPALTQEVAQPFMRSGTLHVFAISGLHIALIAGILVKLLRVFQIPRGICGLIVIPLIWGYTAATGWQASAIRSTVMMTVIVAGWSLERPSHLLNSLAAAGLVILVSDPTQLFQAGFQLSFFVVLGLALIAPPLQRVCENLLRPDPLVPDELRPWWLRGFRALAGFITAGFATSLAAWLGSLPLIAWYFYMVTPVSLLANLIVVPLSGAALASSLGSLLCGDWLPWFTELFNHASWLLMKIMVSVSEWAARLPGAFFYTRPPVWIEFAAYYTILAAVLSGWLFRAGRWKWGLPVILSVMTVWAAVRFHRGNDVVITVPPLGGAGIFVTAPDAESGLLIDPGDGSGTGLLLKPFLRSHGVNRLSNLVLTHGDVRRVGGYDVLADDFTLEKITISRVPFRSRAYRDILERPATSLPPRTVVRRGDRIGQWRVLHPDAGDRFVQADDSALVLLGEFGPFRVLALSDLGKLGQQTLIGREPDLRADFVITGLPGRSEPLTDALLESIQPRAILVASAEFPANARLNSQQRRRLEGFDIPLISTDDTGAATLRLSPSGWELKTMSGIRLAGGKR